MGHREYSIRVTRHHRPCNRATALTSAPKRLFLVFVLYHKLKVVSVKVKLLSVACIIRLMALTAALSFTGLRLTSTLLLGFRAAANVFCVVCDFLNNFFMTCVRFRVFHVS
ncbi:unnamed protein product [Ectocarpus sp. 8 AP-2014]